MREAVLRLYERSQGRILDAGGVPGRPVPGRKSLRLRRRPLGSDETLDLLTINEGLRITARVANSVMV
jgi:hypothetical protein